MTWERRYPLVAAAGHIGGDQQVGEAYSARWARELPDGRWSVVSRVYYVAKSGNDKAMMEKTDYVVCSDVGGTEIASSVAYSRVTSEPPLDDAAVQDAAREAWAPTNAEWNNAMPGWQVPW